MGTDLKEALALQLLTQDQLAFQFDSRQLGRRERWLRLHEVDSLARGMWLEFDQPDDGKRKVKLAWISPLKTLYIFSTSGRQEAFSITGEAMAQQFRDGTVRLIRTESVVAAALSVAMSGVAAVNDEHHDLPANGTSA